MITLSVWKRKNYKFWKRICRDKKLKEDEFETILIWNIFYQ